MPQLPFFGKVFMDYLRPLTPFWGWIKWWMAPWVSSSVSHGCVRCTADESLTRNIKLLPEFLVECKYRSVESAAKLTYFWFGNNEILATCLRTASIERCVNSQISSTSSKFHHHHISRDGRSQLSRSPIWFRYAESAPQDWFSYACPKFVAASMPDLDSFSATDRLRTWTVDG